MENIYYVYVILNLEELGDYKNESKIINFTEFINESKKRSSQI